ncbi:cysteine desulfurase family protein [uncultured Chitinophaga sp.]|uniref:cysteine desulfurase family protein n=1 Tax=uncultured Chitinophaga sp. TaxID=339340 RepID=UPI0025F87A92|nr:cysteine desulfurase family protein [uncultured Chitinophaga sp.]
MDHQPIYLDYNATTPCDPRVVEAMLPYFTQYFGNPASADHQYGWKAKDAADEAREQIAALIGAAAGQVIFTSGATESINLGLKSIAAKAGHIISCKTEHKAVLDTLAYLETKGLSVTYLDTNESGALSPAAVEAAVTPDTIAVAIMYANNETGVIHPVKEIGNITRQHNIAFFCDATQAVGKINVDVERDNIDLMAFSSHKLYGPKGVGALYTRQRRTLFAQQHGGSHEFGLRSGTLNMPGIVGFGKAAAICALEMQQEAQRLSALRDQLEQTMLQQLPGASVNGGHNRLPHVTNLLLPHPNAEQLLLSLSAHLALSRGSACSGLVQQPSHVLKAMGLNDEQVYRAVRFSLGRFTSGNDIDKAMMYITHAILHGEPAG